MYGYKPDVFINFHYIYYFLYLARESFIYIYVYNIYSLRGCLGVPYIGDERIRRDCFTVRCSRFCVYVGCGVYLLSSVFTRGRLDGNNIGVEGIKHLCQAGLRHCPLLTHLW